jgi:hypothetical protein
VIRKQTEATSNVPPNRWQRRLLQVPGPREPTFRSFWGAWRTIAGYEAIHMIRKGQARWSAKVGLLQRFILGLFAATN